MVKTLRGCIGLGLLVVLMGDSLKAKELPAVGETITVSVYDDAGVGLNTLVRAEEVASHVFRQAKLSIAWLNCGVDGKLTGLPNCGKVVFPTSLQLRMLKKSRGLTPETFGISYLFAAGEGCYRQIFVEPVERLHQALAMSMPNLLGHVAAHELAHLLLGTNSHSVVGLMRARWGVTELNRVNHGTLLFDRGEAHRMAERLIAGARRNAEVAIAAAVLRPRPPAGPSTRVGGIGVASRTD